jgi:hypothetical protein
MKGDRSAFLTHMALPSFLCVCPITGLETLLGDEYGKVGFCNHQRLTHTWEAFHSVFSTGLATDEV